jgi:azurin
VRGLVFFVVLVAGAPAAAQVEAPRIFLDQPERIVEYQLNRLPVDQLMAVERRDTDARYRPVYLALLTRPGVPRSIRDEAVASLVKLGVASPSHALLLALSKVPADGTAVAEILTQQLLSQPVAELSPRKELFLRTTADGGGAPFETAAAYGALLQIEPEPSVIWSAAAGRAGHLQLLLDGARFLPGGRGPGSYRDDVAALITDAISSGRLSIEERGKAIRAIGTRADEATASVMVNELRASSDPVVRESVATTLKDNPALTWRIPMPLVPAFVEALRSWIASLDPGDRTRPAVLDALSVGEFAASRLPAEQRILAVRSLRAVGAKVVRITPRPEQVSFDVRWFAVEAGRPVQLVLENPDAMPHNIVIGEPGSLQAIGNAAGRLTMPSDSAAKAFVPEMPEVLFSTRLAQQGETVRLAFTAPSTPGSYVFACTFPGHWVRMYGVMLVVPNLEAWEAAPTVPNDPMTGQPFQAITE